MLTLTDNHHDTVWPSVCYTLCDLLRDVKERYKNTNFLTFHGMECVNSVKFFDEIPNRVHSNESLAESFSRLFVSPWTLISIWDFSSSWIDFSGSERVQSILHWTCWTCVSQINNRTCFHPLNSTHCNATFWTFQVFYLFTVLFTKTLQRNWSLI